MGRAITFRTSYPCSGRDAPTLRPARGKRMNVANEEVLPITKTNSQCAGSHGNGPVPELGTDNIETGNTPTLATLNGRRWDGWNIIREIQWPVASGQWPVSPLATIYCPLITDYVWGLDINGTLQGAGGVGGLLAVVKSDSATNNSPLATGNWQLFLPTYDANGNITEYVTTNGEIVAHYDYSPFGEPLIESGDLASTFTHRFSTKPRCPVTGLYEYQMRKYRQEIGRWLSRDPMAENESYNLFLYVANDVINDIDYLGEISIRYTPPPNSMVTPFELGIEWLTGLGPRHRDFVDGDAFAEQMRAHKHIQNKIMEIKNELESRCGIDVFYVGPYILDGQAGNYNLSGVRGVINYIGDYSNLLTFGAFGNLAVTFTGSYSARFEAKKVDCCKKTSDLTIIINNRSHAASALRPPIIGYTQWWQRHIAPAINRLFQSGPGSPTTQKITLTESLAF